MSAIAIAKDLVQACKRAWKVTELCVERWAKRGCFGLLVAALSAPLAPRHFKFRAEDAAQMITLADDNRWGLSTSTVRAVYARMATHVDERGTCWIGVNRLAQELGFDPRTVRRAQAALRALGFLVSFKRFEIDERLPGNWERSNVHVLLLGPELAAASDSRSNALPRRAPSCAGSTSPATPPSSASSGPFVSPVEQLNRVTTVRPPLDPGWVAKLAQEARCPIPAAIAAVDQARVKAFAGIHGGETHWTRRLPLLRTLASFFNAAAERAGQARPAPSVEEMLAAEEKRERDEQARLDALRRGPGRQPVQRVAGAAAPEALAILAKLTKPPE